MLSNSEALKLEYPYMWDSEEGLLEAFQELKTSTLDIKEDVEYSIDNMRTAGYNRWARKGTAVITHEWNVVDRLSSYFNEHVRVKCKREDERSSPFDYWNANKKDIVSTTKPLTSFDLNTSIWKIIKGCGMFRPYLMTGWIKRLEARSVLDFSSGWGDRLLGAMAAKVRYVGVDPNTNLVDSYKQMIDTFATDKSLYTMIPEPFQTCTLPKGETFDLVFTSPPYFNLEVYSTDVTQSYVRGNNVVDWLITFMFPSLDKAWNVLNDNGTMCVIINDSKYGHYVESIITYMKTVPNASEVSMIPYIGGNEKPQPMWFWTKNITTVSQVNRPMLSLDTGDKYSIIRTDRLSSSLYEVPTSMYIDTIDASELVYCHVNDTQAKEVIPILSGTGGTVTVFTEDTIDYPNVTVRDGDILEAKKYTSRTPNSHYVDLDNSVHIYLLMKYLKSILGDLEPARLMMISDDTVLVKALAYLWPTTKFVLGGLNSLTASKHITASSQLLPQTIIDRDDLLNFANEQPSKGYYVWY